MGVWEGNGSIFLTNPIPLVDQGPKVLSANMKEESLQPWHGQGRFKALC